MERFPISTTDITPSPAQHLVVRSYPLGNQQESKTALLSLFRRVLKDTAPVHVIDTRAQADALILGALEELKSLKFVTNKACA